MMKRDVRPIYLDEKNRPQVLQVGDGYAPLPMKMALRDRWPVTVGQLEILLPVTMMVGLAFGARGAAAVVVTGVVSIFAQVLVWGRR